VTRVKICGVTTPEQAMACVALGADAVGVNLIASSPRHVDPANARKIALAVGDRALTVAVVADLGVEGMRAFRTEIGAGCLQLHGDESAADVAALLPHAYKAVRVADARDIALAESMPGEYVLVDAHVPGMLGGTGHRVDPELVVDLAARRRLVLAGGLDPVNVAGVVQRVRPWCVDVASGVESAPGVKDLVKVKAFVDAVRGALR
jgi:phosphoribosylanthranilate isomerase